MGFEGETCVQSPDLLVPCCVTLTESQHPPFPPPQGELNDIYSMGIF